MNKVTDDLLAEDEMSIQFESFFRQEEQVGPMLDQDLVQNEGLPHEAIPEVTKSDKRLKSSAWRLVFGAKVRLLSFTHLWRSLRHELHGPEYQALLQRRHRQVTHAQGARKSERPPQSAHEDVK